MRIKSGSIFVGVLSFLPVLLWAASSPLSEKFSSFDTALSSLGQISALIGTALYSITLFLSARLKIFERFFEGLNQVYVKHSQYGQLALILMLFHPLLLLPLYTSTWTEAFSFLLPDSNWAVNWGIFSLGLMIVLIVLTLYLRPRYNLWKWTHKFLGLAFFFGALHVWMIPSDTSRFLPLRVYILGLAAIGLSAFFYRTVFGVFAVKKWRYKVSSIRRLNESTVEISMEPESENMSFKPGQFVFVQFKSSTVTSESHPFSIVSAPEEKTLRVAVKSLGDYTATLDKLKLGDKAMIEGPFGYFTLDHTHSTRQIWLAGGIGVTPFLSLATSLPNGMDVDFFYCVGKDEEAVYRQELESLGQKNPNFRFHLFTSEKNGRIDADFIQKEVQTFDQKDILLCAPPAMIHALRSQFLQKKVATACIHSEEFNF